MDAQTTRPSTIDLDEYNRITITKAGIYDIPSTAYHRDPVPGGSLSFSGAVKLLPPSCPAKYKYALDHPEPPNGNYDIGKAAHELVLRGEDAVVIIHADDWRLKTSREQRDHAYAQGLVPLLVKHWQTVQDMAGALWGNPLATALLSGGKPEQAIFWQDRGIWRRMLTDFLPDRDYADMYAVDYKSAACAHPDAISRALWSYRYVQQADWYLTGLRSTGLTDTTRRFFFIVQEKSPPYVVTVAQPVAAALEWGHILNEDAITRYRQCKATGRWPGYSDDVVSVSLPTYAEYQLYDATESGDLANG